MQDCTGNTFVSAVLKRAQGWDLWGIGDPLFGLKLGVKGGKEPEYKPVTTLTSQTFEGREYMNICLGCFQLWPSTARGFGTVTTKQGFGSFCIVFFLLIFVNRRFCSCFCCCGCVGLWHRTCKVKCTVIYRTMLQTLKSILLAPNVFWLAGVNLSFVHGSVRNWKTWRQLLANVYSCHFSSLENDLKFHL